MVKLFLITVLIIAISFIFLAIKIILQKNGRFPNVHVGNSKEMRKRGIGCVQSQDRQARQENKKRIKEY
ncbi:MAG: hypothetical protein Q4A08_06415 [Bacteroidales bacterium]|nr:hypothetical protein [Bacteroidales bacterium]